MKGSSETDKRGQTSAHMAKASNTFAPIIGWVGLNIDPSNNNLSP